MMRAVATFTVATCFRSRVSSTPADIGVERRHVTASESVSHRRPIVYWETFKDENANDNNCCCNSGQDDVKCCVIILVFCLYVARDFCKASLWLVNKQDSACPLSWNFEIEIFSSQSLHGLVVRYRVKSRGARSNCCRDIAFCRFFQVKCERTSRLIMA